jgi:GT2 family glycosyltransferase
MSVDVAVVVASLGRPESLDHLLHRLAGQTKLPSQVVLSVATESDLPAGRKVPFQLNVIVETPRGSTIQRNRALDLVESTTDIVVFYDDDFVPSASSIADLVCFFAANPDIAGADGLVLADGVTGPGITIDDAITIVEAADQARQTVDLVSLKPAGTLYGCNMAYRYEEIWNVRFDENLPLYGWLEDMDFGARVKGRLAHSRAFQGVHRGEKAGRERGCRLGYSQVANPIYMTSKGTLSPAYCAWAIARRFAMNHLRSLRPEPWVDRRGRVIGNWMAVADLVRGRLHPQRILEF